MTFRRMSFNIHKYDGKHNGIQKNDSLQDVIQNNANWQNDNQKNGILNS